MTSERFKDQTAIITGGADGLGLHIATRLVEEGARVWIVDRDQERGKAAAERIGCEFELLDVADEVSVNAAFEKLASDRGPVDVLVNNAGIAHVGNLETTTSEDLDRIYGVNVKGVYHCMRAAIDGMMEGGQGVILNMASIASPLGIQDRFAYSMSKGAVLTMTLSVARDYVEKGIRCNCICPGRVHTPFVDGFIKKNYPGEEEAVFDKLSKYQPIGRMGKPEEIAGLAVYLCSDEAAFITGSAYDIDGGCTLLR